MFCGSFHPEEDDEPGTSPCSTPRKYRSKDNRNPYSARGLDRFEALLADLEEKRQRIYTQRGSDDVSFVRFSYTTSNHCVPIVVKQKDRANDDGNANREGKGEHEHGSRSNSNEEMKDVFPVESPPRDEGSESGAEKQSSSPSPSAPWSAYLKTENWRRPSYYLPVAIVLILLFLAVSGRSAAILCTSIGWYVVPVLKGSEPSQGRKPSTKKKQQGRRSGEKKTVTADKSPQHQNHRKSH